MRLLVVGVFWLVGRWCCSLEIVMLCRCLMSDVCSSCFLLGVVVCTLLFAVFGCCRMSCFFVVGIMWFVA